MGLKLRRGRRNPLAIQRRTIRADQQHPLARIDHSPRRRRKALSKVTPALVRQPHSRGQKFRPCAITSGRRRA
jgi:hypothetical protein